ncbi:MAG: hypothetical protein ACJAV6_000243 [Candidatus Paceibacteria bacterium]|jgi:hypothetical protein
MKRLSFKKIALAFLTLILVGNTFSTNIQTFDTSAEQCHLQDLHTSPCAVVTIGGIVFEIEQDIDASSPSLELTMYDFEFISLVQAEISPSTNDYFRYYADNEAPPSRTQLARSHLAFS